MERLAGEAELAEGAVGNRIDPRSNGILFWYISTSCNCERRVEECGRVIDLFREWDQDGPGFVRAACHLDVLDPKWHWYNTALSWKKNMGKADVAFRCGHRSEFKRGCEYLKKGWPI